MQVVAAALEQLQVAQAVLAVAVMLAMQVQVTLLTGQQIQAVEVVHKEILHIQEVVVVPALLFCLFQHQNTLAQRQVHQR
jgi:hypothetical protein